MIITCEACNTSFNLDDKMIKPSGSKVRCSICANVFTVFPRAEADDEPLVAAVADGGSEEAKPPEAPASQAAYETATDDAPPPVAADETPPPPEVPETNELDITDDDLAFDFDTDDTPGPADEADLSMDDDLDLDFEPAEDAGEDGEATVIAELDDDLDLGMAFDEEPSGDNAEATVLADIDDDLDLDLEAASGGMDTDATVIADLDDDDFDLSLDDIPGTMETTITDLDKEDLEASLTDGAGATADESESATIIANLDDDLSLEDGDAASGEAADDGLDFSLDLDFPEADAAASDTADTATAEGADDELSLDFDLESESDVVPASADDELSLDFDIEPEADATPEPADDELSLDFDLETDPEAGIDTVTGSADAEIADDLDLSLDLDDGTPEPEALEADDSQMLEDDLDMSGLEALLEDDDDGGADQASAETDDDGELSLALDEDDVEAAETVVMESSLDGLDLDLGDGDAADSLDLGEGADGDDDAELDLSEIEKMLEEPEGGGGKLSAVPEQDLDLDIEASMETEKWMSESADGEGPLLKDDELDLSELEQVLDDVDTDAVDEAVEDPELELDLGDDSKQGTPDETLALEDDLDFDLSAFETEEPAKPSKTAADGDGEEMELDFEIEEETPEENEADAGLEETVAIVEEPAKTKAESTKAKPSKPVRPAPSHKKQGSRKSLVILLIILLLGGGGYAAYFFMNQSGMQIPFLSSFMKPKVNDPGNMKLTTYDINSRFADNANVGKLFVISGKVKNGYTENRGIVTLTGKLISSDKVVVNNEKVYAGNVLADSELASLEWDKIKARLSNRLGDNRSNEKIEPGKSIPFMVVFSGLPDDLEEFTIEVTGSTPLK